MKLNKLQNHQSHLQRCKIIFYTTNDVLTKEHGFIAGYITIHYNLIFGPDNLQYPT